MHSALHLMCASIPLGVTGGQIGYEKSRLDFNDPNKEIRKEYEDLLNYCKADNRAFPINWYKVMEILETRKLPRHCWGYYDSLILGYWNDYNVSQKIERFHKQIQYGAFMTHSPTHFKKLKEAS